jgi:hypothetical protein
VCKGKAELSTLLYAKKNFSSCGDNQCRTSGLDLFRSLAAARESSLNRFDQLDPSTGRLKRIRHPRHYIVLYCAVHLEKEDPLMPGYRFGKHPPKVDYRTLHFRNYALPGIAAPPSTYNVLTASVYPKLKTTDPTKLFPMDGNDTLGDCTIAALAHAETVFPSSFTCT